MRIARNYVLIVCAVMPLVACSGRPVQELAAARSAVDELIGEGAELFAPEELREINDNLSYALMLIKIEDHDLVKNYRLAGHILQQVRNEAEALKVKVICRKEELHEAALTALKEARSAVSKVSMTLTGIMNDPLLPSNANLLLYDAEQLMSALDKVSRQIKAGDFVAATAQARSVAAQAVTIYQTIHPSRSASN